MQKEIVNARFNAELMQQIAGTLPTGHIYRFGRPSEILLSAGLPDLPIEMASSRLENKSQQIDSKLDIRKFNGVYRQKKNG